MKNIDTWRPSKFTYENGKLRASRKAGNVGYGSRLAANMVAFTYEENLKKHAGGKLLDLGCGKIPFFVVYRDLTSDVVCVDWANTQHPNPHIDFEADLNAPLAFADNSFDTILLSDVLEHIYYPEQLWREMGRILKPGGKLLLNVPYMYWIHEEPFDFFRYTEFALKNFASQAKLNIIHFQALGGAFEVMTDIIGKNLLRVPLVGRTLSVILQDIAFGFFRQRSRHNNQLNRFPLGYFLVAQKAHQSS
jgi:SAM-dependent methyltransferase